MDKNSVLKTVALFAEDLNKQGVRTERIILYGSWAKGGAREDSDIDVVVISRDFEGKGYWERIDALAAAISAVFAPIEAIAFTPDEWERGESIMVDYAKEGEVVYAA